MAATATTHGLETCESNNAALSSFIANAWFKHADSLRLVVREDSDQIREIDRAIQKLCSIAGHQGIVKPPLSKSSQSRPTGASPRASSVDGSQSKSILGKRRVTFNGDGKTKRRDFSKARCDTCGELGHTTNYHDKYIQLKRNGMANAARSSIAKFHEEAETDDCEDAQDGDESSEPRE
ncbi:hypothetical protein F441_03961 [Phytophthora nicotianae CJ01A1]|uniref:Uncharacterized protein n=2 Tax=Phytophthora nicotianae TaxID=4792 RepID=W2HE57_PHYNI|nr:hypothetical protein L915_03865 [Phytophthora nicotianae]ETL46290.1 hypothetical protein L916_03807 [Phytophthora nicotianae]ETP22818.1 hypothetical protein F441_03961 [Phytophthora nicotianae CJ01A1]